MQLEGIHHITAITAGAQGNVDFYAGVLGLRLVKKSVNQDQTSVYHLFYADEEGEPGSDITFFEYPGLPKGRAGAGMMPLTARHPEIPAEHALQGFHAARAYAQDPARSAELLTTTLGFEPREHGPVQTAAYEVRGDSRGGLYLYDAPPPERGLQGAGTVHHIAFAAQPEDEAAWQQRVSQAGAHATQIIDRHYFKSVYFREPSGVLFEIATLGPGFTVDEPLEHLGEKLSLTPQYEHLREQIEPTLTPLHNPRERWAKA